VANVSAVRNGIRFDQSISVDDKMGEDFSEMNFQPEDFSENKAPDIRVRIKDQIGPANHSIQNLQREDSNRILGSFPLPM
jgi:hypothetical protein